MKLSRSFLRERTMIILYQIYLYRKENLEFDVKSVIKENLEIENEFVNSLVFGILEKEEEIDSIINKYMKDWTVKRLGQTDKAIIRMSTYELLYMDTPKIVSINEGIELAKKYSDDKVVSLFNAVLDSIMDNEVKDE